MIYEEKIKLKNGHDAYLRNGYASDGNTLYELFNATHAETDYLLSYPEENSHNPQQEGEFLDEKFKSPNEIEILAIVDDKVVGTQESKQSVQNTRYDTGLNSESVFSKNTGDLDLARRSQVPAFSVQKKPASFSWS